MSSTELVSWRPEFEAARAALTTVGSKPLTPPEGLAVLDAEQVQAAIASRILALDADAALSLDATRGPVSGEDIIGVPIVLTGGEFLPSNVKKAPGFYMVLTFDRLDNGERGMVSTGANTVMTQLLKRMCEDGPWPTPPVVWCQREEPTQSGGRPEWLEPVQPEE